jgi:isoleucyl-tRNA synthetase
MALARQAVEMGRALRAERNIKNRQPLRRLRIVARSETAAAHLRALEDLIRDELNVKEVDVSLDESSFVSYKAKPNFKTLGARLGKDMKAVAGKCANLSHDQIKSVLEGTPLHFDEADLTADDLLIVRETAPELAVVASPDLTVALDTAVDEALRLEMLAREVVSRIQNLRKDSGLAVTDRVTVALDGVSAGIRQAVETHRDYISAEVLADSVLLEGPGSGASEILDVDGETARIFVAKA